MHKGISLFQKHGHLTITFFPFIIYMPFGRPSVDVVPWRTICPLMLNTFLDDSSILTSSVSGLMSVTVPSNSPFRQIPFFPKKRLSSYLVWVGVKFSNAKEEELLINDASQIGSKKFDFSIE